jgi:hypothetical protein
VTPALLAQGPPVRVGIVTGATEAQIAMDGGGQIQDLKGHALRTVKDGEKIRLWWDTRGLVPKDTEYRVQVGAPMALGAAEGRRGAARSMPSRRTTAASRSRRACASCPAAR